MDRTQLLKRLAYLANMLESLSDSEDKQLVKEVRTEYMQISKELYPPTKEHEIPSAKVKESRKKALEKIKTYLESEDIEKQFENIKSEEAIVSWQGNVSGMPKVFSIEGVDSFYKDYSGYICIAARKCLFSQKQLKGYRTFERALLEEGLKLCSNRTEKKEFFEKYVTVYNEKIKK